jgi:hypothetical protein
MYLVTMEQANREHIAAAAAAQRELGPEYEGPVAESLVDRIGAEIDRRVDAKLAEKGKGRRRPADVELTDRHRGLWLGIGIGSAATGVTALIVAAAIAPHIDANLQGPLRSYNVTGDMLGGLVGVWGLLLVIFIVHTWVQHVRRRE